MSKHWKERGHAWVIENLLYGTLHSRYGGPVLYRTKREAQEAKRLYTFDSRVVKVCVKYEEIKK